MSEFDVSNHLKAPVALRPGKLPLIPILGIFTGNFLKQHLSNRYPFMGKHLSFCDTEGKFSVEIRYEGWNFNFGNTPLDWIQELLE